MLSGTRGLLLVSYNPNLTREQVPKGSNMPDSARLGGFVVQARVIAGASWDPKGVPGRPCQHSRFCVRPEDHTKKTCIQGRDMMLGGTTVGFVGFAAIGHLSGQKDYAINHHLCLPTRWPSSGCSWVSIIISHPPLFSISHDPALKARSGLALMTGRESYKFLKNVLALALV